MRLTAGGLALGLLLIALTAFPANYPSWWHAREVVLPNAAVTNDFAPVNQGQLKWFVTQARNELETKLPGGAGPAIATLAASFSPTNNFRPVNAGQLKAVAKPFYDRLIAAGLTNSYPWTTNATADDRDFALVNQGQVKFVFSFAVYAPAQPGTASIRGMIANTGPQTGTIWVVAVTAPDSWSTNYRACLAAPGAYELTHLPTATNYWVKAWCDYDGDATFAAIEANGGLPNAPLFLTTNISSANIALSDARDSDGDSLPDFWEINHFGNLDQCASGDFDRDGLNNGYEYQYGCRPTCADTDGDGMSDCDELRRQYIVAWGFNFDGQCDIPAAAMSNVVAVSAGGSHSLALLGDGRVVAWGENWDGQCDVPDGALSNIVAVSAGGYQSLGMRHDGRVVFWGSMSDDFDQLIAPPDAELTDIVAIGAGWNHCLALRADGRVVAWGANGDGQCNVPEAAAYNVVAISAGYAHNLALLSDGRVVVWGYNSAGQCDVPDAELSNIVAVSAGGYHSLALRGDGRLVAWGDNGYGQCDVPEAALSDIVAISAQYSYNVALRNDGRVAAWGINFSGRCDVPEAASNMIVAVSAGEAHGLALRRPCNPLDRDTDDDGLLDGEEVMIYGTNPGLADSDQDGLSDGAEVQNHTDPLDPDPDHDGLLDGAEVLVYGTNPLNSDTDGDGLLDGAEVNTYGTNPALADSDHDGLSDCDELHRQYVVAWGYNFDGRCDIPATAMSNVVAVSAGGTHSLALLGDGRVVAWGQNWAGQCDVPDGALSNIVAVAAGYVHSLALRHDGRVVFWGSMNDDFGQLIAPPDAELTDIVAIGAGENHCLALRADGRVVAWGANGDGQCNVPEAAAYNVVAISAGYAHNLALLSDGRVVVWGYNSAGQCDVPEAELSNIVAVSAGGVHSLALRGDCRLVAWGDNGWGQCDVPEAALSDIMAISAQYSYNLALRKDGRVVAWGINISGRCDVPEAAANKIVAVSAGTGHGLALRRPCNPLDSDTDDDGLLDGEEVMIYGTNPGLADSDQDGLSDGAEVQNYFTNPLDSDSDNDGLPDGEEVLDYHTNPLRCTAMTISGTVSYAGPQTGTIWVVAMPVPSGMNGEIFTHLAAPGVYTLTNMPPGDYFVCAWRDTNGNGMYEEWEPYGTFFVNPAHFDDDRRNQDVLLSAPDADVDGLPDWWEIGWFGDVVSQSATNDPDCDGLINLQEYFQGRNPSSGSLHYDGLTDYQEVMLGGATCWGDRSHGQCSPPPTLHSVVAIAAGTRHGAALRLDGTVVCWGDNTYGQCNVPPDLTNVVAIGAGWLNTIAVKSDGSIAAWGSYWYQDNSIVPIFVPPWATDIRAVAGGRCHTVALTKEGRVLCWGMPWLDQCNVPTDLYNVTAIAAGKYSTLALCANGTLAGWGDRFYGQSSFPDDLTNAVALAAYNHNVAVVRANGTVALNATAASDVGPGMPPVGLSNVASVAIGDMHAIALRTDGSLVAWGSNAQGQCVPTDTNLFAVAIAAGDRFSMALQRPNPGVAAEGDPAYRPTPVPGDYNLNGLPDWWEFLYFGTLDLRGIMDPNHDGTPIATDYQHGTDPVHGALWVETVSNGGVRVAWNTSDTPGLSGLAWSLRNEAATVLSTGSALAATSVDRLDISVPMQAAATAYTLQLTAQAATGALWTRSVSWMQPGTNACQDLSVTALSPAAGAQSWSARDPAIIYSTTVDISTFVANWSHLYVASTPSGGGWTNMTGLTLEIRDRSGNIKFSQELGQMEDSMEVTRAISAPGRYTCDLRYDGKSSRVNPYKALYLLNWNPTVTITADAYMPVGGNSQIKVQLNSQPPHSGTFTCQWSATANRNLTFLNTPPRTFSPSCSTVNLTVTVQGPSVTINDTIISITPGSSSVGNASATAQTTCFGIVWRKIVAYGPSYIGDCCEVFLALDRFNQPHARFMGALAPPDMGHWGTLTISDDYQNTYYTAYVLNGIQSFMFRYDPYPRLPSRNLTVSWTVDGHTYTDITQPDMVEGYISREFGVSMEATLDTASHWQKGSAGLVCVDYPGASVDTTVGLALDFPYTMPRSIGDRSDLYWDSTYSERPAFVDFLNAPEVGGTIKIQRADDKLTLWNGWSEELIFGGTDGNTIQYDLADPDQRTQFLHDFYLYFTNHDPYYSNFGIPEAYPCALLPFTLGISATASVTSLTLSYTDPIVQQTCSATLPVTRITEVSLVPDYNHDRTIDVATDETQIAAGNPFRFWTNDDDDFEGGALDVSPAAHCPNIAYADREFVFHPPIPSVVEPVAPKYLDSQSDKVSGVSDRVDFFPVDLNITSALQIFPSSDWQYYLCQEGGALKAFLDTDLTRSTVAKYLTDTTWAEDQAHAGAAVQEIRSDLSCEIPAAVLQKIVSGTGGIILLEGVRGSSQPLQLKIRRRNTADSAYVLGSMPLRITGVQQMFRCLNLRPICGDVSAVPNLPPHSTVFPGSPVAQLAEPPNNPDVLSNGKNLVFIHGFNEDPSQAIGNICETFKRLYWSGSKAKFTGVTWFGNDVPQPSFYHRNVKHAFATAASLADYMNGLTGEVNVMAFSLGNMVVSSAIQDHQATNTHYFLLHAAVAREAYNGNAMDADMVADSWSSRDSRVFASNWYKLWDSTPTDHRNNLKWNGRFSSIDSSKVYNYYSTGEDVLKNLPAQQPGPGSSIWEWLLQQCGSNGAHPSWYAWGLQEICKGNYPELFGGSLYGGWGLNEDDAYGTLLDFDGVGVWAPNEQAIAAAANNPNQLKINPVFNRRGDVLSDASLYQAPNDPNGVGSRFARDNRGNLLSEMIPALSFATGANAVRGWPNNFDMQGPIGTGMQNGWPQVRRQVDPSRPWQHGDYKTVAYLYVYKLFDNIRDKGQLNQ